MPPSSSSRPATSFGPRPWIQQHWDWRAAGNFVFGGLGTGLIVAGALSDAPAAARPWLAAAGAALVGLGLFCVWLEIGRPLRAIRVFRNPRTSWMSREAIASLFVFGAVAGGLLHGATWWPVVAALAAIAFVWCQTRILQAARGIPAWREPMLPPLLLASAYAEGCGLLAVAMLAIGGAGAREASMLAVAVVLRFGAWLAYRSRVVGRVSKQAAAVLDALGSAVAIAGTLVPLALLAVGWMFGASALLAAVAGLFAAGAGAWFKLGLVTRASWNQGFAVPHLPVRGARG